jgi:AcrR family transcriptional regulator
MRTDVNLVTVSRRELLLERAAELFAAKGFHAVGIDDIGEAAGITGPGVYRHFASKQALLVTLITSTMERMLDTAEHTRDLDRLLDAHLDLVTEEKALISVWVREQRALDDEVRRPLSRQMRRYEAVWHEAVQPLRPELSEADLAFVVRSALAMLNTTTLIDSPLPPQERREVLRRLARAALAA